MTDQTAATADEPVSPNNDGWTGRDCPQCGGAQMIHDEDGRLQQCGKCAGTGQEYIQALDKRMA
jgi:ribosomal protein S27AE